LRDVLVDLERIVICARCVIEHADGCSFEKSVDVALARCAVSEGRTFAFVDGDGNRMDGDHGWKLQQQRRRTLQKTPVAETFSDESLEFLTLAGEQRKEDWLTKMMSNING